MTRVPGLRSVHRTLRLKEILPVSDYGRPGPQTGCRPLVVEVGRDPSLHLVPLAQVERGPVEEMVVAGREIVDEVKSAPRIVLSVLGDTPDIIGQEGEGKCTNGVKLMIELNKT